MTQKPKRKPARKAVAKKAARPKAAKPRAKAKAKAPAPRKTAKPRKASAKKPAARKASPRKARARKSASAKLTSIERASAAAELQSTAGGTSDEIRLDSPALAALELAFSGGATADGPAPQDQPFPQDPLMDPEAAARRAGTEDAGSESGEGPARVNKLVPTNAVHTTKRRAKRNTWQGPALAFGAIAAVLAIVVLGQDSAPPDVSPLEQRASALVTDSPSQDVAGAEVSDPFRAAPDGGIQTARRPEVPDWRRQPDQPDQSAGKNSEPSLRVLELVELERMLERLEMGPSRPDGIVDAQTESAIRMYQQIAGLPVDGEPSRELLNDMREVVKMLDESN